MLGILNKNVVEVMALPFTYLQALRSYVDD